MNVNYQQWLGPKMGPITLSKWSPNPNRFKVIELTNEKLKIEPQTALAIRSSDLALCEDANGYLTWFFYTGLEERPTKKFYIEHLEKCYETLL